MPRLPLQLERGRSRLQLEVNENELGPELEAMLEAMEEAEASSKGSIFEEGISEVMMEEGGSSEAMREAADATRRPPLLQTDPQAELQAELQVELQAERVGEMGEMGEMSGMGGGMDGGMDGGVGEQETQAPVLAMPGVERLGPAAARPAGGVGDGGDGGVDDDDDDEVFWRDEQALAQIDEVVRRSVEADAQRCGRSG